MSGTSPASIGQVEAQSYTFGAEKDPFVLRCGTALPSVTQWYETYGELNAARDNAILVFHALSGSQHAAGHNPHPPGTDNLWTSDCHRGWWDGFIGPGKAFDTDRFCVICVNFIGGCYGSTGPSSLDPVTGKRYAGSFPRVTIADIVDAQMALLDHLGIERLHAVTGGSVGGMLSLSLATRFPNRVGIVIPIASGIRVTSLQRIINYEQIFAIENDPQFQEGNYYDGKRPEVGVCMARMISHKTFVSLHTLQRRARREVTPDDEAFSFYRIADPIESYMLHQGKKFTRRFDANTYLRILDAWQTYDLLGDAGAATFTELFEPCRDQRYLVFSIDSDVCFYPEEQEALTSILVDVGAKQRRITVHSDKGHDAFLLEPALLTPHLSHALERDWD